MMPNGHTVFTQCSYCRRRKECHARNAEDHSYWVGQYCDECYDWIDKNEHNWDCWEAEMRTRHRISCTAKHHPLKRLLENLQIREIMVAFGYDGRSQFRLYVATPLQPPPPPPPLRPLPPPPQPLRRRNRCSHSSDGADARPDPWSDLTEEPREALARPRAKSQAITPATSSDGADAQPMVRQEQREAAARPAKSQAFTPATRVGIEDGAYVRAATAGEPSHTAGRAPPDWMVLTRDEVRALHTVKLQDFKEATKRHARALTWRDLSPDDFLTLSRVMPEALTRISAELDARGLRGRGRSSTSGGQSLDARQIVDPRRASQARHPARCLLDASARLDTLEEILTRSLRPGQTIDTLAALESEVRTTIASLREMIADAVQQLP